MVLHGFFFDSGKWKSTVLHDFKFTELDSVLMWPHNTGKRKGSLADDWEHVRDTGFSSFGDPLFTPLKNHM